MSYIDHLSNQFLIAMPTLADPNFDHTVTYLCDHNQEGALGIVINRPTDLTLADLAEQLNIEVTEPELAETPIYQGGPVQLERGFVLHSPLGEWDSTLEVTPDTGLTMSSDIIDAIANGVGPQKFLIALGYAGWGQGQLETELAANSWLNGPADNRIIFDYPVNERWSAAAAALGVDIKNLSTDVGHA
jgi:putative transcriptional regulator